MATLVLSAAGMALGGSIGGTVAGLSMAAIGRAGGAILGQIIDQRLVGSGSRAVETGRVDRFRLMGASEGAAIQQVYGRMRVGGHVIWATRFKETVTETTESIGGGKGSPPSQTVTTTAYTYSVSLAIAVCEGEISRIGRIWADGEEIATSELNMRVYPGSNTQLPDPKIQAVQGADSTPAFRGTAYVVFEDLQLEQFGNRVPQFSFEVLRPAQDAGDTFPADLTDAVTAVAMMPGSGEYTLATTPVNLASGLGRIKTLNVHTASGETDMETSLSGMVEELPKSKSTSLIVSWFGDDLRVGQCSLTPRVEQTVLDGAEMPWKVSGLQRNDAQRVPYLDDRPAYGGTPTDQSVVEAIGALRSKGQGVLFYPFILMTQLDGNELPNPWSDDLGQPAFPWRGRITTSVAPGRNGTTDGTATAQAEVDAFFGTAQPGDFQRSDTHVGYTGPQEWSYRRFILHYAHLCVAAGGVDAFCIGSEMRSLTWIRGASGQFVAVQHLVQLAADVRSILGPNTKISYAADWSEYFGYQPQDGSNDRYFHLDPLWSDPNIDFVAIDNYMPLSDWRQDCDHLDADWGSIYNLDYLAANIEGGEGFDWYYTTSEARDAQFRTPIQDASESEPWAFRYKDIRGWWSNPHYERVGGVRSLSQTGWMPQSKPIWFTELGAAAVNFATNQPNKFLDPKSSESLLPHYSNGQRDELIQMQYLRAMFGYWSDPTHNPVSSEYGGPMIDMSRAHVWAWDARPYPYFPDRLNVWSDGANYAKGHWITGRTNAWPLDSLVRHICNRAGVTDVDVSELYGYVRGYAVDDVADARAALQPLMLAYGFTVAEREGTLVFRNHTGAISTLVDPDRFVLGADTDPALQLTRDPAIEIMDRVRLNYVLADGAFEVAAAEAVFPEDDTQSVAMTELNLALTRSEAQSITERWLAQSRVSRDKVRFALPPSQSGLGATDIVSIPEPGGLGHYRIDQVEVAGQRLIEAVRTEDARCSAPVPEVSEAQEASTISTTPTVATPVFPLFLDLPLLTGDELPHAPHMAVTADPWPGIARVAQSQTDSGYLNLATAPIAATMGLTLTDLPSAPHGVLDHGPGLEVDLTQGTLASATHDAVLAGANAAVIGDGSPDNWEVFQFEKADLIGQNTYRLSRRLRGQLGTDALMPDVWPAGSYFLLLNGAVSQLDLPSASRGVLQYLKVAPGTVPLTHPSVTSRQAVFQGNGLRPYAPVWVTATSNGGDMDVTWIRRTRMDSNDWTAQEPPLHEAFERYQVNVLSAGVPVRSETIDGPGWTYTAAKQADDGVSGAVTIQVAQVSDVYGPGLYRSIDVTL